MEGALEEENPAKLARIGCWGGNKQAFRQSKLEPGSAILAGVLHVNNKRNRRRSVSFNIDVNEEFEFLPQTPEQFFVRAMNSGVPLFLTESLLNSISSIDPDELVEKIINDLHKDSEKTDPTLRWFYLMMDFQEDFPRLMQLIAAREAARSAIPPEPPEE